MTRKHLAAHNLLGRFAKLPGIALQIELAIPSVEQNARDTQMTTRALVSRVSQLRRSTLARACTPLTKAEEKETARSLAIRSCSSL